MAVKDDYVMRMIKDMARVLARLILGKDDINYVCLLYTSDAADD